MLGRMRDHLDEQIRAMRSSGLYKEERVLAGPQGARVSLRDGRKILNLCSNNYLGLAGHPDLIAAAKEGLDAWGYGLSSVRFICGTQSIHKQLEDRVSAFLGTEDTILYSSCFDANGGLFETLLGEEDAIVSDALNHASIIDGIRLCKARRLRYRNGDLADLDTRLTEARDARFRLVATDGVFSMDGTIANLASICDLAEKHNALVMVDDSHAVGVLGKNGAGSPEHCGVRGRVDILTGTFGKALGGASGGYTSGRREIIEMLRQRSRPYLFSNTLAPGVAAASIKAIEMVSGSGDSRAALVRNTQIFRKGLARCGFETVVGEHPIVPVMLGEAERAVRMADRLLEEGVYVIGFSYPVAPKGQARIRVQLSAALTEEDVRFALEQFEKVGRELGAI